MSTYGLLTAAPQLTRYDHRQWVLHCPSGHNVLLNEAMAELLRLLAAAPDITTGWARFNVRFESELTLTEFEGLLTTRLGGYQLLQQDTSFVRPAATGPIHHQLELLSSRWAGWLAAPLTKLYKPEVFWPLLLGVGGSLACLCQYQPALTTWSASGWGLVLFYGSVPVHELGHIAACRRAGVAHGGIGVGLYYFFPLLYADISGVWQAPRHQRIIANLGGILSQLLYAGGLASAGLVLHQGVLLLVAQAVALSAAWQLNPFLQHDGYWVLSDLSNTPNLLSRSKKLRQLLLTRQGLRRLRERPLRERARDPRSWVLFYGLLNTVLLVGLMSYALASSGQVLHQLPGLAHTLLTKLSEGTLTLADFPVQLLTVLAIYGWLLRTVMARVLRARPPRPATE